MGILDELRDKADQIRSIGTEARAEARALGVPSYYIDATIGEGIIEELPDGSKNTIATESPGLKENEQAA
jgi:hypothetical protein